jgi:hypothetical protein
MRLLVGLFAASAEVMSFVTEPIAMLLWGIALLGLCSILRRTSQPKTAPAASAVDAGDNRALDATIEAVPSLAARS